MEDRSVGWFIALALGGAAVIAGLQVAGQLAELKRGDAAAQCAALARIERGGRGYRGRLSVAERIYVHDVCSRPGGLIPLELEGGQLA